MHLNGALERTYAWNEDDRLAGIAYSNPPGTPFAGAYGPDGARVGKTDSGGARTSRPNGPAEWEYDLLTLAFHDTTGQDPNVDPPITGLNGVAYSGVGVNRALRAYDQTSPLPFGNVHWGWADLQPGAFSVSDASDPERRLIGIVFGSNHFDSIAYMASMGGTYNGGAAPAPGAPTNLVATCVQPSVETDAYSIELAWTPPAGTVEGYKIQRFDADVQRWVTLATTTQPAYSVTEAQAPRDGEHFFRVAAYRDLTSAWAVVGPIATPPARPDSGEATPTENTHDQMHVQWEDQSDVETGSVVQRSLGVGQPVWADVESLLPGVANYDDSGLTKLTTYRYRIKAMRDELYSYSPVFQGTTHDEPPAAPTGLVATSNVWNRVDLAWVDASNNETSFELERSTVGANFAPLQVLQASSTSFADTTARYPNTYTYRLRAVNGGGPSDWVATASAIAPPAPPAPEAPSNLVATATFDSAIQLSWFDRSDCETGFSVERRYSGGPWTRVAELPEDATNWVDEPVTAGTNDYRVRSWNETAASAWVGPASATVYDVAAGELMGAQALATSAHSIAVYWSEYPGAIGYVLTRSTHEQSLFVPITGVIRPLDPAPGLVDRYRYVDTNLSESVTYYYQVTPVKGDGTFGPRSDIPYDSPAASAIPWDASASEIVAKSVEWVTANQPSAALTGDISITLPNGCVVYRRSSFGTPVLIPATRSLDSDGQMITETRTGKQYPKSRDGDVATAPDSPPSVAEEVFTEGRGTGPYRKVQAQPGFSSLTAAVYLPPVPSQDAPHYDSGAGDTGWIYTGGEGTISVIGSNRQQRTQSLSIDIGFSKGLPDNLASGWGPDGWLVLGRTRLNLAHSDRQDSVTWSGERIRAGGWVRITMLLPDGSAARSQTGSFNIDTLQNAGGRMVSLNGTTLDVTSLTCVFALPSVHTVVGSSAGAFRIKRVNSIAQKCKDSFEANFPEEGTNARFFHRYSQGAIIRNGAWGIETDTQNAVRVDGNLLEGDALRRAGGAPFTPVSPNSSLNPPNGFVICRRVLNPFYAEDHISVSTKP